MNRINGLVLLSLITTFLVGCGGGGSSSTGTNAGTTPIVTTTDVRVERGPLLGATVKDANNQVATALSTSSNVYTFAITPIYPITATGGYIDVDANGIIDTNDIAFTGILKSYSTVVTPITTYIATGTTEVDRTAKLAELKAKIGGTVSDDDLLKKVPSATTADIIVLTNAIYDSYSVLFDTDTSNDDISTVTTLDNKINTYRATITQSGTGKTVKELAKLVEEELMSEKGISKLTENEVAIHDHSSSIVSGKIIVVTDSEGDTTLTYNSNGTYSESGFDVQTQSNYSCSGLWKDLGNNKIGFTCANNGTSVVPDGTVDSLEAIAQLSSNKPVVNDKATVSGHYGQSYEVTIKSISSIFQSGETFKGLAYNIVTSPITGKQWLDRNLGASQACTSSTDSACYGDYYQWGRLADGHEKVNSELTMTQATSIINVGREFITSSTDWTSIDSDGALRAAKWSKTDGTGVCPGGFKVPTLIELKNETMDYDGIDVNQLNGKVKVIDSTTAFQNFLKFPTTGYRNSDGMSIRNPGYVYLWNADTNLAVTVFAINSSYLGGYSHKHGMPIRCVEGN